MDKTKELSKLEAQEKEYRILLKDMQVQYETVRKQWIDIQQQIKTLQDTDYVITEPPDCPHCKKEMMRIDIAYTPSHAKWGVDWLYVCGNDDCPLYIEGEKHVKKAYGMTASYRFIVSPDNGVECVAVCPVSNKKRKEHYKENGRETSERVLTKS